MAAICEIGQRTTEIRQATAHVQVVTNPLEQFQKVREF